MEEREGEGRRPEEKTVEEREGEGSLRRMRREAVARYTEEPCTHNDGNGESS